MNTKVIVLGEPDWKPTGDKPIEFVKYWDEDGESAKPLSKPSQFAHIELSSINYILTDMQLMFAYNECREHGVVFLGHFNDGIVNNDK